MTRRFPAPWSVRELEHAFRIEDATGQAVAYTYFRRDENEARQAQVLTHDEARRIAANIAKLPELLCGAAQAIIEPMPHEPEALISWAKRNIKTEE
ncbi:MAG: hypothetical protein U1E81_16105 [Xanthobacteraceae bacterium]